MIVLTRHDKKEVVLTRDRKLPAKQQTTFFFSPPHPKYADKIEEMLWENAGGLAELFRWTQEQDEKEGKDDQSLPLELLREIPVLELIRVVVPATLSGWKNLRGKNGKEIEWMPDESEAGMEPGQLSLFGLTDKVEMFLHGFSLLNISEDDVKN